jgi:hypothetical protein
MWPERRERARVGVKLAGGGGGCARCTGKLHGKRISLWEKGAVQGFDLPGVRRDSVPKTIANAFESTGCEDIDSSVEGQVGGLECTEMHGNVV